MASNCDIKCKKNGICSGYCEKHGVSASFSDELLSAWPKERRIEVEMLLDLIHEIRFLDKGTGAISRIPKLIEMAEELDRVDLEKNRAAFTLFIVQQAAGEGT